MTPDRIGGLTLSGSRVCASVGGRRIATTGYAAHPFGPLLASEWTKIRSVRSTIWALVLLIVLTLGFAVLITALTGAQWDKTDASQRADIRADPVRQILAAGFQLSQLTISYSA